MQGDNDLKATYGLLATMKVAPTVVNDKINELENNAGVTIVVHIIRKLILGNIENQRYRATTI